jgi:hypothetical protein
MTIRAEVQATVALALLSTEATRNSMSTSWQVNVSCFNPQRLDESSSRHSCLTATLQLNSRGVGAPPGELDDIRPQSPVERSRSSLAPLPYRKSLLAL